MANGEALAVTHFVQFQRGWDRMTCPVVRVAKRDEGEVEVGKELKEVGEGGGKLWLIC